MRTQRFGGRETKFWIVVSEEQGMSPFPYIHESAESAFTEAERLARGPTGHRFYVLKGQGCVMRTDISVKSFEDDGIPF